MSRFTKRDRYGHAYTNETIYDRGMTSKDGKTYEKHYFENGTSAYDGKPIDRLCELEDKIEQGKLVEVVRCKDCKHCSKLEKIIPVCSHEKNVLITESAPKRVHMLVVSDYHYCSYGERREDTE